MKLFPYNFEIVEHRNDTQQSPPEPTNCETDSESLSDVDFQHCELSDGETSLPTMKQNQLVECLI